ncbi:hypothetical protein ACKKBG_A28795 [Auxenochlorella protothecoides x Auxenochlorella symbiontica]
MALKTKTNSASTSPGPPSPPAFSPPPLPPLPPGKKYSPPPPGKGSPSPSPSPGFPPPPGSSSNVVPTPSGDVPFTVPSGWTALWWEEFEGDSLDSNFWQYDVGNGNWGWGNGEEEYYTTDNVAVQNGQLQITAKRETVNGFSYTSGRINSQGLVGFCPGVADSSGKTYSTLKLEVFLQTPAPGQGQWPAFWLLPTTLTYGAWPMSGEIDVLESINAMTRATQGLHYGKGSSGAIKNTFYTKSDADKSWSSAFNTFAVTWTSTSITFSINGNDIRTLQSSSVSGDGWFTSASNKTPNAPFDVPFYMILNLALGGNWAGPVNASTPLPTTLLVDYIRLTGTN